MSIYLYFFTAILFHSFLHSLAHEGYQVIIPRDHDFPVALEDVEKHHLLVILVEKKKMTFSFSDPRSGFNKYLLCSGNGNHELILKKEGIGTCEPLLPFKPYHFLATVSSSTGDIKVNKETVGKKEYERVWIRVEETDVGRLLLSHCYQNCSFEHCSSTTEQTELEVASSTEGCQKRCKECPTTSTTEQTTTPDYTTGGTTESTTAQSQNGSSIGNEIILYAAIGCLALFLLCALIANFIQWRKRKNMKLESSSVNRKVAQHSSRPVANVASAGSPPQPVGNKGNADCEGEETINDLYIPLEDMRANASASARSPFQAVANKGYNPSDCEGEETINDLYVPLEDMRSGARAPYTGPPGGIKH